MKIIWKLTGWKAIAPPFILILAKFVGIVQLDWLWVLVGCLVWFGFTVSTGTEDNDDDN